MTEVQFTAKLLHALRQAMPDATVLKHCDLVSGGIPDFSVTRFDGVAPYARTTWVEVKLIGAPSVMFKPLQVEMLRKLGGWYCVWSPKLKQGWLFRIDERAYWHKESGYNFTELIEKIKRLL